MVETKSFENIISHKKGEGIKSLTGKSVVIDFYADWCAPCKVAGPIIEKMSEEMPEVDFIAVDITKSTELAEVFNIKAIPAFIVVTPEGSVATTIGWETEEILRKFIQNSITTGEEN